MFVTLEEAKGYLRVDSSDEDVFVLRLMDTADSLIQQVTRRDSEELKEYESIVRTAELYVIAYLFEHREEADHKAMTETLKYLLFGIRKENF
nr:MAG TPA: head tail connector [Caudoviricetes sp.]